jgi:membrane fusion protein (multidrug efflux system)
MRVSIAIFACLFVACSKEAPVKMDAPPAASAGAAGVEVLPVVSKPLETTTHLEAELTPYEAVALHARANGFVQRVLVDRGSKVKTGDPLVTIVAPELIAQRAEAEAKFQADKSTSERLRAASQTPGAVSGQELEVAAAAASADEQRVQALRQMEQYLAVTAPFDGVVTERNVHPGALVGPESADKGIPMLRLEQVARLRLTVAVPESYVGEVAEGVVASFTVRTWPGEKFQGVTKRLAHSIDTKTRTMAIELDVENKDGRLAPGMFADVVWPVKKTGPSLFVPPSSIVVTTDKTFVVRVKDGVVDQVNVQRGMKVGDLVEVLGDLRAGDLVAKRGSDELRAGAQVAVKVVAAGDAK